MPKSGTSSLHEALKILGIRSIHYPDDRTTEEVRMANYRLSILERYDAVLDNPIPGIFAQLDEAWPGSKFILTIRPIEKWLESSRRAGFNQAYATPKAGSVRDFQRVLLFGCSIFNENRYRWVYKTHHALVSKYFEGEKAGQLLTLDFGGGDGWEKLCPFLGYPVPDVPFPHANPRSKQMELNFAQKGLVGLLVKAGVDYRFLRRTGRKLFRR
ncbi:hypothetical protein LT988_03385 [Thiocapsa bogorovii]|nr:hypothetical protein LT988_03385 [Thiocapsa bogorovii]